jgi:hypothetical protein
LKNKPLQRQLEEEVQTLIRLREYISELRHGMEFAERGLEVFYVVDFSEIVGYLKIHTQETDEIDKDFVGVNLDSEHPEKGHSHYRLGLTHLFNTFDGTLYLLPPHTLELWNFARAQGHHKISRDAHFHELVEFTTNLDPRYRALLESLMDQHETLEPETSRQLLKFVKSPAFLDVSELLGWIKRGYALNSLFQSGRLSYKLDQLLTKNKVPFVELKEPRREETLYLLEHFPRTRRRLRRSQTIVDSRALLFLRNINRILNPAGAAVVLVTRDAHLLEVAKSLAGDSQFDWGDARRHIRGIESVFLDLILAKTPVEEKSRWMEEADRQLVTMRKSVSNTLIQLSQSGTGESQLRKLGKKVIEETSQLWDEQINVRLSIASKNIEWLGPGFLKAFSEENLPADFKEHPGEYRLLKNLFEFLSIKEYHDVAVQDIQTIFRNIEIDCLRIGFLNILDEAGAERVSKALANAFDSEKASGIVVASLLFTRLPSVQFVSETYKERLKSLDVKDQAKYNRALLAMISEAVSGFNEPEDLLFMALVLGRIGEWQEALRLTDQCRQMVKELDASSQAAMIMPSEIDYFTSLIKRRKAEMEPDAVEAMRLYVDAYYDIRRALDASPRNPKYAKDVAASAMLYHEIKK